MFVLATLLWEISRETTKIFDKVEHLQTQGVTYWAERNEPLVIQKIMSQKKWIISCIL